MKFGLCTCLVTLERGVACQCVCVRACVCVLDGEGTKVFASRALVVVSIDGSVLQPGLQ